MKKSVYLFCFCLLSLTSFAQTASIESGCVPLVVSFESPDNLSDFFWDFMDGASSVLEDPEHTFIDPGVYEVILREGQGGAVVGSINITVYPDPVINIDANVVTGCPLLSVDFTSNIEIDDDLTIEQINWVFGDGSSSMEMNPTHVYSAVGTYSISVQITTNEMECDKTEIFEDFITVVDGIGNVGFNLDFDNACQAPSTININNTSTQASNLSFMWDFGNGSTSTVFSPPPIVYNEEGIYDITLTVTSTEGCTRTFTRSLTVGQPVFDVMLPDSACLNIPISIDNETAASNFQWNFGSGAIPATSTEAAPEVRFVTPGLRTIELQSFDDANCIIDTSFQLFIEEVSANFEFDPMLGCLDNQTVEVAADIQNYVEYIWNDSLTASPSFDLILECGPLDSLHVNEPESVPISLTVVSELGCRDMQTSIFTRRKPYAHFLPSTSRGCAPLEVEFTDISQSSSGLDNYFWTFGDGNTETRTDSLEFTHVFQDPGEYYVQLIASTIEGCADTSAGRWIFVGEPIAPEYTISDLDICLNEEISITLDNQDPRIDAWHVNSDNGRTGHCYDSDTLNHQFITETGNFDITLSIDYNGCINEVVLPEMITVGGAKADLSHKTECETPFEMVINNEGQNASSVIWLLDGDTISMLDSTLYTFAETGDYELSLITRDTTSSCPADTTTTDIFIRNPQAMFEFPENICDNLVYELDASASVDVDLSCSHGFLWNLPFTRPREVNTPVIEHTFPQAGEYELTLIVEDKNRCRDTLTRTTTVFGIEAIIDVEKDRTCLPDTITYINLSTSDTTLVSETWTNGSMDSIIEVIYDDPTLASGSTIMFELELEDAIGCTDSVSHNLIVYTPESNINIDAGPTICLGNEINFSADDFTQEGSSLEWQWDFENFGTATGQDVNILFDQVDTVTVELAFVEIDSGCRDTLSLDINVIPFPIADFSSSLDGQDPICHPAQIELENTSTTVGPTSEVWFIDGEGPFLQDMPSFAFDKGLHEVQLISSSIFGCADTITQTYNLVGPEGSFTANTTDICFGDELILTLQDTADVGSWQWTFGDGVIENNSDPAIHTYEFNPDSVNISTRPVSLVLSSQETGCELTQSIVVSIDELVALFNVSDSLNYCEGLAFFENETIGGATFTWSTNDDGVFSNEVNPSIDFMRTGDIDVTLEATNANGTCVSEVTNTITLPEVDDFVDLPNVFTPNGDGVNDRFNVVVTNEDFAEFVNVLTFKVYDRWGKLIYDNETPDLGWDGRYKNEDAPNDAYAYFIEYEIVNCGVDSFKGNVTLIQRN